MSYLTRRRVEFRDTDAAGIVHFSAFFPWMEAAEHEMLRSVGIEILPKHVGPEGAITWPRVSASCDYSGAAHFEDWIQIEVEITKIGRSSVVYRFTFRKSDRPDSDVPVPIASGEIVVVCCRLRPGGKLEKVSIPGEIREKLHSIKPS